MLEHKVFYRVFREKFLELTIQLAGEGLIMGYHQSGVLELVAFPEAFHKGFYSLGLVAGGLVFAVKFECSLFDERSLFHMQFIGGSDDKFAKRFVVLI